MIVLLLELTSLMSAVEYHQMRRQRFAVTDIAVKILELSKPLLEFGHEPCEQV